ncbi:MAG: hypothetical protein IIZ94_06715 [Prevotella sp.]|nr:hypothetical protein [Prevotella sp.]
MDIIEILEELRDNAEELNEPKYKDAFNAAIQAIYDSRTYLELINIYEELLIKELGKEWHTKFAERVAAEKLRRDIKAMGDNDFTRFVMDHFDEITNMNQ